MNAHHTYLILKLQGAKLSSGQHLKDESVYFKIRRVMQTRFQSFVPVSF